MSVNSRSYENFLNLRKQDYSTFLWVSRQLNPQVAYKQISARPTPASHKEDVLRSPKIQELLDLASKKQNVSKTELENQVRKILDEIGYNKNLKVIRWLAIILVKICLRVSSGIYINKDSLLQFKSTMGNYPVVFVPSHRSYADFILMSFVCFTYDIEIPAIAAGMDFHAMWGMGSMLRDTGAFFMRRSYNNDGLYWTTFKQYIYQLVTKGDLPIEFFIEGTRSRSNKSLAPKYGLISMVLKAFFFSEVQDIIFVPININYDRILEESLFAFELLGIPKPKESTSGFFKSLKIIKEKFGNIYFHIDKPISARAFFGDQLDRSVHNMIPLHLQEMTEAEKKLIPFLAHEIVHRQQKSCVITIFNLVSLILNNNLASRQELLTVAELTREVYWIKSVIEFYGAFVYTENVEESIKECFTVHKNLIEISSDGRVCLVRNNIVLDKFNPSKLKAHSLSEATMTYALPFVLLQIYINPTLQYFVDTALLVIILSRHVYLKKEELFNNYHFIRSLFSMEFVTIVPWEKTSFETALQQSTSLNLIKSSNENCYELGDDKKLQEFLFKSIEPFIVSYSVVCFILQRVPLVTDEKTILANVQQVLENKISEGSEFVHPYCLNLDTLGNCLNSLSSVGVVNVQRRDSKLIYEINREKIVHVKEKIEIYIPKCHIASNFIVQPHLQNKL